MFAEAARLEIDQKKQNRYISRPLLNRDEIRSAQRLIYQVYVEEMGWIPAEDNPSEIQLVNWENYKIFVDSFDEVAIWFGTFYDQELIACWRFCRPLNHLFELERYHPIPDFLKYSRSLEVTRLAIHQNHRNKSRVMLNLAQQTFLYLHQDFDYTFSAVTFPYPGNLYLKLGLKKVDLAPFKYSSSDQAEVSLIYLNYKDRTTLVSRGSKGNPFQEEA